MCYGIKCHAEELEPLRRSFELVFANCVFIIPCFALLVNGLPKKVFILAHSFFSDEQPPCRDWAPAGRRSAKGNWKKKLAKLLLGQSFAQCTALIQCIAVRGFLGNHRFCAQGSARSGAAVLPIAHPLTVAPAVRAKQRHGFAF